MKTQSHSRRVDVRKIAMTGMLSAVAAVLMFLSFSIPLVPSFLKMDFSELPALIASFAFGPVSGAAVCLVKNLVNVLSTTTGGVGELSNFLLGVSFVVPAGWIYARHKTRRGAIVGALGGAVAMALMPMEAILGMYRAINPRVETLLQALVWFNLPFTLVKGLCSVAISMGIYKPLSPILKGVGRKK